jgi:ferric-dicitrate binding protein FerR (iron transport regulator)
MDKETELYELFRRFAEDTYTKNDLKRIKKNLENPATREKLESAVRQYWYRNIIHNSEDQPEIDLQASLDKVHHRINQMHHHPVASKGKVRQFLKRSLHVYYRAAAILLIPLLAYTGLYLMNRQTTAPAEQKQAVDNQPVYSEIIAPMGSRIEMGLPDGSRVWLNHGSRLKYPRSFGKGTRKVYLKGEAYFEVEADKQRPFVVNTPVMDVCATGTEFNVLAYPDEKEVGVTLDGGSVDLYKTWQEDNDHQKICGLVPGEHAVYDKKENAMNIVAGKNDIHTAWRNGKMIFRKEPLNRIVIRLERRYNVDINIRDKNLATEEFTATFTDETLQQVLELFSKAAPLEYEFLPRKKKEDNSFTKRKVVIRLKK